jgi:hypothetical protein
MGKIMSVPRLRHNEVGAPVPAPIRRRLFLYRYRKSLDRYRRAGYFTGIEKSETVTRGTTMEMPAAFVLAVNGVTHEYASALPGAPVVPHVERPRRVRTVRTALANGLIQVARVIAPT